IRCPRKAGEIIRNPPVMPPILSALIIICYSYDGLSSTQPPVLQVPGRSRRFREFTCYPFLLTVTIPAPPAPPTGAPHPPRDSAAASPHRSTSPIAPPAPRAAPRTAPAHPAAPPPRS